MKHIMKLLILGFVLTMSLSAFATTGQQDPDNPPAPGATICNGETDESVAPPAGETGANNQEATPDG